MKTLHIIIFYLIITLPFFGYSQSLVKPIEGMGTISIECHELLDDVTIEIDTFYVTVSCKDSTLNRLLIIEKEKYKINLWPGIYNVNFELLDHRILKIEGVIINANHIRYLNPGFKREN
jgi:hypothetical protein